MLTDFISIERINKLLVSAVIIIAVAVLWRFIKRGFESLKKKGGEGGVLSIMSGQAGNTIYGVTKLLLTLFAVILILQVNGINISSLITGLGVAAIVVGLAVQDILKDVIMGLRIMLDGFYAIGDVIKYGDFEGRVEKFNLRTTTLRNVYDGSLMTLCNSNIHEAHKISTQNDLLIPLSYSADFRHVHEVFRDIAAEVSEMQGIDACRYLGTQEFADSSINYLLRFWCDQGRKAELRRKILAIIQDRLDREGLEIPFNQLDVHVDGLK